MNNVMYCVLFVDAFKYSKSKLGTITSDFTMELTPGEGKIRTLVNVNISSSSMIGMGFWQTISVLLWMKCELAHNQSCFKLEDPNRAQKWAEVGLPS